MQTRRSTLRALGLAGATALAGCGGGDAPTTTAAGGPAPGTGTAEAFTLTSEAFGDGEPIPERYTADGADVSPPVSVSGVGTSAETLALVVDDPDAPGGTFVHWLLWNLPADRTTVPEDVPGDETVAALGGARQGTNGFGTVGYRGPAPPAGDDPHTYRFTAYAVDTTLSLAAGAERAGLESALADSVLVTARLTGEYGR